MSSIMKTISPNNLALTNYHLNDVMIEDKYIEIGNINYNVFNNLIRGKLVQLKDLSFFKIQNIGLGHSEIEDDDKIDDNIGLRELVPYIRLANTVKNNSAMIVVITYGLLIQRTKRKNFAAHEEFTPMVLIPVQMYIDQDNISFQMISQPFANPKLKPIGRISNRQANAENLNSFNAIDQYCLSYNVFGGVRLESYVTYIQLSTTKANFTNNYENGAINLSRIETKYNIENNGLYYLTKLNKVQRIALEKAHYGQSFEIVGFDGTGKTTALANIAMNAAYNKKRVLYLSSQEETLSSVEKLIENKNLNSVVSPLNKPFNQLREKQFNNSSKVDYKEALQENLKIKSKLDQLYKSHDNYVSLMFGRINNFYCIDLLDNCIHYKDVKKSFEEGIVKEFKHIFKEEFDSVIESLAIVDTNIHSIESICKSDFTPIPSSVHAKYDDVMNVLSDLSNKYKRVKQINEKLNTQFGCVSAENYAFVRSFINNYHCKDTINMPKIWLKHNDKYLYEFEKTKDVFLSFKNEMILLQDKIEEINSLYHVDILKKMDVEKEAQYIFDRFRNYDNKTINKFLKENGKIIETLEEFIATVKKGQNSFEEMKKVLSYDIQNSDDDLMEKLISFIMFANQNSYSSQWFNLSNKESIRKKIVEIKEELDQYEEEKRELNITDTKHLSEYIESLKFKSFVRFKDARLKDYLKKAQDLLQKSKMIESVYQSYVMFVGCEYQYEDTPIKKFDRFTTLFSEIENPEIQASLTKALTTGTKEEIQERIQPFLDFGEFYIQINQKNKLLQNYCLCKYKQKVFDKLQDILDCYQYCLQTKKYQNDFARVIKEQHYYILLEDINRLRNHLNEKETMEQSIDNNENYKRLLSDYYRGHTSDVSQIEKLINDFNTYTKDFLTVEAATKDFTNPYAMSYLMNEYIGLCEEIVESIKNYSKYFKDSIDFFYYSNLEDVSNKMDQLLSKNEELKIYLNINGALDQLNSVGLTKLSHFIYDECDQSYNYQDTFCKDYFNLLLHDYKETCIEKRPEVVATFEDFHANKNYELITEIQKTEEELIKSNVHVIASSFKNRYFISRLKNMDYHDYLEKTMGIKYIFLATPSLLNAFLDINDYDLVLVDDAHILNSTEFISILGAKQLIVSGTPQAGLAITDDLLSSMKRTSIVKFNYRYDITPNNLLNSIKNLKGNIPSIVQDNYGVNLSKLSISKIFEEILNDCNNQIHDLTINIFIENQEMIDTLYDEFASILIHRNMKREDILYFLTNGLSMVSLSRHYSLKSDYNILYLKDYDSVNDAYEIKNYIALLCITKKKLVICDPDDLLEMTMNKAKKNEDNTEDKTSNVETNTTLPTNDIDDERTKEINKLIGKKSQDSFLRNIYGLLNANIRFETRQNVIYNNRSIQRIVESLNKNNIKVPGNIGNYSLNIQYENKYYGVVLWDCPTAHYSNILNLYRNLNNPSIMGVTFLYLFDLEHNFEDCINRIIAMVQNEPIHNEFIHNEFIQNETVVHELTQNEIGEIQS